MLALFSEKQELEIAFLSCSLFILRQSPGSSVCSIVCFVCVFLKIWPGLLSYGTTSSPIYSFGFWSSHILPCCVSLFLSSILTYVWWARCLLAVFCIYFIICTYLFNVVLHCIWSQSCSLIIQHLPASVRPYTGRLDLAHPWEDVEIFVIIKWVFSAGTGFFFSLHIETWSSY